MQPTLNLRLAGLERRDDARTQIARQKRQNVGAANVEAEGFRLIGKETIERGGVDLGFLDQRPGVRIRIDGVDLADDVDRQAAFALIAVEGVER